MSKGLFITLEGGEGSGKSTIISKLKKQLTANGYEVICTREPGGTALGESIRELLLFQDPDVKISGLSELLLFLAARAEHISSLIQPALNNGFIVICDRFHDSTIAYQTARGLEKKMVQSLCHTIFPEIQPNVTFLLDVDPVIGLKRASKATKSISNKVDRLESEALDFHFQVRENFKILSREFPERIKLIDSSQPLQQMFSKIMHELNALIL